MLSYVGKHKVRFEREENTSGICDRDPSAMTSFNHFSHRLVSSEEEMLKNLTNGLRYGVLAVLLVVIHLSGCVSYGVPPPPQLEPPQPSGTLLKSQFRIGISPDYMPLAYKDPRFGIVGVEVDFANQLGKELGKNIVFVETPFSELINALVAEKVDIIMSGMSITRERAELVNFSDPYVTIGQMALARTKDSSKFREVQSFSSVTSKVGFVRTTTGEMAAKAFFGSAILVPQSTVNDGVAALRNGEIDVFLHDAPTVWRIAGNPNEKELTGLYWLLTKEPLAWAVRKSDEPLRFTLCAQSPASAVAGKWFCKTNFVSMDADKNLVRQRPRSSPLSHER